MCTTPVQIHSSIIITNTIVLSYSDFKTIPLCLIPNIYSLRRYWYFQRKEFSIFKNIKFYLKILYSLLLIVLQLKL